jgi:hypothetical protein
MCLSIWRNPICPFLFLVLRQLKYYSENNCLLLYLQVFFLFPHSGFKVSDLILRSLLHFELTFVQGEIYGFSFSLLQWISSFSYHFLLKRLYFLQRMFWSLFQKLRGLYFCVYFCVFIVFHWPICLYFHASTMCFCYYGSVI